MRVSTYYPTFRAGRVYSVVKVPVVRSFLFRSFVGYSLAHLCAAVYSSVYEYRYKFSAYLCKNVYENDDSCINLCTNGRTIVLCCVYELWREGVFAA